jgi:hypothetical protein
VIGLLCSSAVTLVLFYFYERWREAHDLSVIIPLSIFRKRDTKIGSIIFIVFFSWWTFNTLNYFATL